MRTAVTRQLNG